VVGDVGAEAGRVVSGWRFVACLAVAAVVGGLLAFVTLSAGAEPDPFTCAHLAAVRDDPESAESRSEQEQADLTQAWADAGCTEEGK
jgi:hypothetical protein